MLDVITNSMDMNLSKLQEIVKKRKPGKLQSMELKMSDTTELTNNTDMNTNSNLMAKLWGKIIYRTQVSE